MKLRKPARHSGGLLPAPVLFAQYPDKAGWTWPYVNPDQWNVYQKLTPTSRFSFVAAQAGSDRQYAPDGPQYPVFILGIDANGIPMTRESNIITPQDAVAPLPPAPLISMEMGVVTARIPKTVCPIRPDVWEFANGTTPPGDEPINDWVNEVFAAIDQRTTTGETDTEWRATWQIDNPYVAARYMLDQYSEWSDVLATGSSTP